jgi:phospholipase A1
VRTASVLSALGLAWSVALPAAGQAAPGWERCAAERDPAARLACFDGWASGQAGTAAVPRSEPMGPVAPPTTPPASARPAGDPAAVARAGLRLTPKDGCRQPMYTALSRFWELEGDSDCGNFGLRGFRPTSIAVAGADRVNAQPTSGNPANTAAAALPYRGTEMRLQLSVRSKIAKGLLQHERPEATDSLWFAYTQQSYWQLFTSGLSRPFRSTDHEPEVFYVYPLQSADASRWRLRYTGAGLNHQSNGQSLPLSRSWNRVYWMAGAELGDLQVQGRVWKRLKESAGSDDNPGIGDYVGRAELAVSGQVGREHLLQATWRHALTRAGRGSLRLEWFRTLAGDEDGAGLKLHTQLFTGYGDSLLDFNRRRTVLSIGLSLTDW